MATLESQRPDIRLLFVSLKLAFMSVLIGCSKTTLPNQSIPTLVPVLTATYIPKPTDKPTATPVPILKPAITPAPTATPVPILKPAIAPAPTIANAIYDAVGVRITDLPITPAKIMSALETKDKFP